MIDSALDRIKAVRRRAVGTLYKRSPQEWVAGLTNRTYALISTFRLAGPRGSVPRAPYLTRRDALIEDLLTRVASGQPAAEALSGFDAREFDERVAEYTLVAEWLRQQRGGQDLLDVGCVMNNALVADLLEERCRNVWLVNVASEASRIRNPVFYHLEPLARAFPLGPRFTLITCLSTIEHIGFDNRHYGIALPAEYAAPTREPLLASMRSLAALLVSRGRLLITVPFGERSVVIHPRTGRVAHQVFDWVDVRAATAAFDGSNVAASAEVWEATATDGWRRTDPDTCDARYGDGCPGASAIAVLRCVRD